MPRKMFYYWLVENVVLVSNFYRRWNDSSYFTQRFCFFKLRKRAALPALAVASQLSGFLDCHRRMMKWKLLKTKSFIGLFWIELSQLVGVKLHQKAFKIDQEVFFIKSYLTFARYKFWNFMQWTRHAWSKKGALEWLLFYGNVPFNSVIKHFDWNLKLFKISLQNEMTDSRRKRR